MDFHKQFLKESSGQGEGSPSVRLAIFGKHPGWDDHIPDIGLSSDTLVLLKRHFYVRGIGSIIDSGFWDGLEEKGQVHSFDHQFVIQLGGEFIAGRIWSSSDGKGRKRYPMIAAAHISGYAIDRCLDTVLEALEAFRESCLSLSTADEVLARVDVARGKLETSLYSLPQSGDPFITGRRLLGRMLKKEPLSEEKKHQRLLYEIYNLLGAFAPGKAGKATAAHPEAGEHLRVPQLETATRGEGFLGWLTYFRTQVSAQWPVLLICPCDGSWVDCIVGDFSGSQLRCLKCNLAHTPCVTEIEYNIPEDFTLRTKVLLSGMADWDRVPGENSLFTLPEKPRPSTGNEIPSMRGRTAKKARGGQTPDPDPSSPGGSRKWKLITAGVVLALVAGGVLLLPLLDTDEGGTPVEQGTENEEARQMPEEAVEAIAYLDKASGWYPLFLKFVRTETVRSSWENDPYLADLVERSNDPGLHELLEKVGSLTGMNEAAYAALEADSRDALLDLQAHISATEEKILDWPVWEQISRLREKARESGWEAILKQFGHYEVPLEIGPEVGPRMHELHIGTIDFMSLQELQDVNDELVRQLEVLRERDIAFVAEINASAISSAVTLSGYAEVLREQNGLLRSLQDALAGGADSIRFDLLENDPRFTEAMNEQGNSLRMMAQLLRDYRQLEDEEDPLTGVSSILTRDELEEKLLQISRLAPGQNLDAYRARWEETMSRLALAESIPSVAINLQQIRQEASGISQAFTSLRSELNLAYSESTDVEGWYASLSDKVGRDSVLFYQWVAHLARILPGNTLSGLSDDAEAYLRKREEVNAWIKVFRDMESAFENLSLPPLDPAAIPAVRERREALDAVLEAWRNDRMLDSLKSRIDDLSEAAAPESEWREALDKWEEQFLAPLALFEHDVMEAARSLQEDGAVDPGKVLLFAKRIWPGGQVPACFDRVLQALRDLERVPSLVSIDDLVEIYEQNPEPGLRYRVCQRLSELPDWPATGAGMRQAVTLWQNIRPEAPAPASLKADMLALWQNAMRRSSERAERISLWNFHDDFFEREEMELPDSWRYDRLVSFIEGASFREDASVTAGEERAKLLELLQNSPELAATAEIRSFAGTLEALDLSEESGADYAESFAEWGPARAGWELVDNDPLGAWVHYRWNSDNLSRKTAFDHYDLIFVLIEGGPVEPFYLGTVEVPSGLFFDWMNEEGRWSELDGIFPAEAMNAKGSRRDRIWPEGQGARSWALDEGELWPDDWQFTSRSNYVEVSPGLASASIPTRLSPLNFVSREAAAAWAGGLSCRLPSPEEFMAVAEAIAGEEVEMSGINLRDKSWRIQLEFLRANPDAKILESWPHVNCFIPKGVERKGIDAIAATDSDDGAVWFYEVNFPEAGPLVLKNIRGNVAEFLYDPESDRGFVAGASAMSPPEVSWDQPYPLENVDQQYFSDVGFRMAMDAPRISPKQRLLQVMQSAPLIFLE